MDRDQNTSSGGSDDDYTQEDEAKMDRAAQSGTGGAFGEGTSTSGGGSDSILQDSIAVFGGDSGQTSGTSSSGDPSGGTSTMGSPEALGDTSSTGSLAALDDSSMGDMSDTIGGGGAMGDMSGETPLSGGTARDVLGTGMMPAGGPDSMPADTADDVQPQGGLMAGSSTRGGEVM